ncbi:hypothetical protein F5Y16DRAFT_396994 [Xylariaceae sp. FL0255]|nr:hypothetical protein F5Y16DRAFT_396994 [Xylariaceae sp. FL0255]
MAFSLASLASLLLLLPGLLTASSVQSRSSDKYHYGDRRRLNHPRSHSVILLTNQSTVFSSGTLTTSSSPSSVSVTPTMVKMSTISVQTISTSSSATKTSAPLPSQGLTCAGSVFNKFLSRDDLNDAIGQFCSDAAAQKVHDNDSGSISRIYNGGSRYEVHLAIDWPQGVDISDNMEDNCISKMGLIMDSCDGNDPKNPLDWKHGGHYGHGNVQYDIVPWVDQGYTPGQCSFHLQEDEYWYGLDGPGTERHWVYHIEHATMYDGAGAVISTLGFDDGAQSASDSHPLSWQTPLPDALVITPEAAGHPRDYVQFSIGSQSWSTNDADTAPSRCNVGGWNQNFSPDNRNMDCYFEC